MEKSEHKKKLSHLSTSSETDEYADIINLSKIDFNKSFAVYQPDINFEQKKIHLINKSAANEAIGSANLDFKNNQIGEEEEEDMDDELNWHKCDYFSENELSTSPRKQALPSSPSYANKLNQKKKLIKAKSFSINKSKKSIGNNRLTHNSSNSTSYFHKSMLLKSKSKSACLTKAAHRHHSTCLCCFLHEKYAEYMSISVNHQKLNSSVQTFQNYLFDPDFLNYLKLIDYRQSPSLPLQHVNKKKSGNDNVGSKRVLHSQNKHNKNIINNNNNNINTSSSFSLSISNISLNDDDDEADHYLVTEEKQHKIQNNDYQIHTYNSNQAVLIEEEEEKFLAKGPNSSKKISKLSSSSISSISSMSNSSYSSSFASYSPGETGASGPCRPSQIESMCNDLLELNMKLNAIEAENFENQEKHQQAKELSDTQNIFFQQILKLIDTFINLNKYLIFKLNNSFNFENFSVDNIFRLKKFDQFIKVSKPLMDWLKKMNFEESLKVNTPIRNERIQNLVNSNYLVSQLNSKESDGFILQKTDSSNTANNDITRKHNTNNNITEISKQTQLDRRDAAIYKFAADKKNEPKFKKSRFNADPEQQEATSSNSLKLNSNETNKQETENNENNNVVLMEEIKRLKKKLNIMSSKDYKIIRRSEYEALKFQLKTFRQDYQLEHNEKVYLRANYEEKLRALEPCLSKLTNEIYNYDDF